MKGHTHALSGAAAWLAVTSPSVIATGGYDQSTSVCLAGSVLCAGAALLPDVDHHNGTIAHSLPPLSGVVCKNVEHLSGGHRHATHSWLGVAIFSVMTWASTLGVATIGGRTVAIGAGIVAAIMIAFAAKSLKLTDGLGLKGNAGSFLKSNAGSWFIAIAGAGCATWFLDYQWTWLVACVGIGAFIHCVGDTLTVEGVPWLWPWNPKPPAVIRPLVKWIWHSNGYFAFPILGHTESSREEFFGVLLGGYVVYQIVYFASIATATPIPYVI